MKNGPPTAHSPFWSPPEERSAEQIAAETKAAELGALMRDWLAGPHGPEFQALLNAEFLRVGLPFRIARKGGPPPRC